MRNTLLWSIGSVLAASVMVLGIVFYTVDGQYPAGNSTDNQPISDAQGNPDSPYILRTYQGRLAVFLKGKEEPEMVFDVFVKQLPSYDQGQLSQGIYIADYDTLLKKIEDYIS